MKLKDLAKSLNNEYSSIQKWSFKYGFKSLNNSKIIELDSQQIEILTETARIFREPWFEPCLIVRKTYTILFLLDYCNRIVFCISF